MEEAMHVNVVTVAIQDEEQASASCTTRSCHGSRRRRGSSPATGWSPRDGEGWGIILFESEEAARHVAEMALAHNVGPAPITDIETRAVIAHA
jgi:hypothetical protein